MLQKTTVHISATTDRLLCAAELMELKKPYSDGLLREISVGDIDQFQNAGYCCILLKDKNALKNSWSALTDNFYF